jgi:redox-sensing transcriptional repressor
MDEKRVSQSILSRLPGYLGYLKSLPEDAAPNISATMIANALGTGDVQVRKDLASVSSGGRPKVGYVADRLIDDIENFLGYKDIADAVIVGRGKLGTALMSYEGFRQYGLNIVAAFDVGDEIVFPPEVRIGIVTVPAAAAQSVCDMMVENGILAIMNFAPTHLRVPKNVLVQNEDIAASLALLRKNLTERTKVREL